MDLIFKRKLSDLASNNERHHQIKGTQSWGKLVLGKIYHAKWRGNTICCSLLKQSWEIQFMKYIAVQDHNWCPDSFWNNEKHNFSGGWRWICDRFWSGIQPIDLKIQRGVWYWINSWRFQLIKNLLSQRIKSNLANISFKVILRRIAN